MKQTMVVVGCWKQISSMWSCRETGVLNKDGGLTVGVGETILSVLKGGGMKKNDGKQKI